MNGKCIIFFLFITALALNAFTKKLPRKKNKKYSPFNAVKLMQTFCMSIIKWQNDSIIFIILCCPDILQIMVESSHFLFGKKKKSNKRKNTLSQKDVYMFGSTAKNI